MINVKSHTISEDSSLGEALKKLNELEDDLNLFVLNKSNHLIGTLTDGDCRRGLIAGMGIDEPVASFMNTSFLFVNNNRITIDDVLRSREKKIKLLPVLNDAGSIVKLINFSFYYSFLPIDTIIMAGGEGIRLRPLTENLPKPLLKIGSKPILEHVIDRLIRFGISNFQISINYLGDKIIDYFKDGSDKNVSISYIHENHKMGTIGSLSLAQEIKNEFLLIINSDVLTNINYEDFFIDFMNKDADLSIACVPYSVNIPYAIMETTDDRITALKEKPTLNFVSNAGIYLIKKKHIKRVPKGIFYNATDLIEEMISADFKITYYNILDYWLDIGKLDDYNKAQHDIRHIKL